MTIKFLNPFQGAPSRIDLPGFFLFSPTIFFEIEGAFSISAAFRELELESLHKRLEFIKSGNASKKRIESVMLDLQSNNVIPSEIKELFTKLATIAIKEDEAGGLVPESVGDYELFTQLLGDENKRVNLSQRFILEVEGKSRAALDHLARKQFSSAAKAILDEEFFAPFLWSGIRDALKKVKTSESLFILRVSVAVELFLGLMIIREFEYENQKGQHDLNSFLDIWPLIEEKPKNTFGRLFEWVKKEAKVRTIAELSNHQALVDIEMDPLRLKRWSNGSHQPKRDWLESIAECLWADPNYAPLTIRLGTAQYANFLGNITQSILTKIPPNSPAEYYMGIYPWPNFPHETVDFSTWGRTRYDFWRDYARDYQ